MICSAVGFGGISLQFRTPSTSLAACQNAASQPIAPAMPVHITIAGEKLNAATPRITK